MGSSPADKTPLSLQGILQICAVGIRGVGADRNRLSCIDDTELAENLGHTEVFHAKNSNNGSGRIEHKNLRNLLRFSRVQSIGKLRNELAEMDLIDGR